MSDKVENPSANEILHGDEIVISGISGCFPQAEDTQQLSENLYNKVNMVSKSKEFADIKHLEIPQHMGKIKGVEKFDAQFFRVTPWQAASLEPLSRKVLELTFSAFFDAGVNPETLKGSKLGVFIASMQTDSSFLCLYNVFRKNGFIISGASKTMIANRVSYWLDGKGPSYWFDNGCAGSSSSLEMAYNRMKAGEIDCAIVGGCNLCLHPVLTLNLKRAGLLCHDGKTKCFDKNGDGYVRSDAISICFLQKAKDAKRIYSEVYHIKGKYFASPDASFSLTRNPKDIEQFLEEFYSEIDVSPEDVEYIEANAFGIAEADGNELEAIGNVFGKHKTVKIGSVKSNMGNAESASGACSVTKMCLAYQEGKIPANLHYKEPQNHIPAVKEGKLQVVTEHAPFDRSFTAINNFCYTGSNFHLLLKGHYKPKNTERYKSTIPRLVLVSGRQKDSVNKMLDILEKNPIDPEQYALLYNVFKCNLPGFTGRGYTILDSNEEKETVSLSRSFEFYSGNTRPVWFLYSGMGSQWAGMGEGLLRLPVFAAAIERCRKVLLPKGLDIIKIITDKDSEQLNILNSLMAITAIQIGLTDVLTSLKIVPDYIIGHSVGELASAYADGSLTAEQTILASYSRAIVSYETKFIKGKMAAVGLGHKKVSSLCPPEIQVACHNSSESATISGPAAIVTEFLKSLTDQGIFAKEVACSNIAFHSRYVAKAGADMLEMQKQFIKEPKLRSEKWLSTCFLPTDWHKPESKYASAEYFTHNLLSSVLFEEAAQLIPDDAIIIEIAPHGLLQAIMKRSHSQCMNLSLTRRGENDGVKLLLESIGKLYQAGLNPDMDALYPKVEFPVSTETPLLSHLVGWEHSVDWPLDTFSLEEPKKSPSKEYIFSIHDDDYNFLRGHNRNGVNVLPEAAVLVFVWETLSEYMGLNYRDVAVVFDDIKYHNEIIIKPEESLKLNITIQKGSNKFEVLNDNKVVADGFIYEIKKNIKKCGEITLSENDRLLNETDVYTILSHEGYSYEGEFQSIKSTNIERNKGTLKWTGNWITFLDSIIQLKILSKYCSGVSAVKFITKLSINIDEHRKFVSSTTDGVHTYNALVLDDIGETKCGGVIFEDIFFKTISKIPQIPQTLKTRKFMAHAPAYDVDVNTALLFNLQVLSENISNDVIKIKEIVTVEESNVSSMLKKLSKEMPLHNIVIETINARCTPYLDKTNVINTDVLIFHNIFENYELFEKTLNEINEDTCILAIENGVYEQTAFKYKMETITFIHTTNQTIILLKKAKPFNENNVTVISNQAGYTFSGNKLKNELREDNSILLVVEKRPDLNIQNLIKEVKNNENISLFIIDTNSPKFAITNNFYKLQIKKGLQVNILENGQWGSFAYIYANTKPKNVRNVTLIAKEQDNIGSLTWTAAPDMSNKQTIEVCYSGLSTRDCKKLSEMAENTSFGMDFSGIDSRGKRVMGLLPKNTVASQVEADYDLLWPVPQHWTLAEAATVPLPYVHAFYCLAIRSSLFRNGKVFVTGAAGALGQAVIAVAHSLGCTVFATVSNADKKRFLLKLFPELNEKNIGYTYEAAFQEMVVSRTKNERCNIVINCGSGKIREAAMTCVGHMKYFLDLNDNDHKENDKFSMFYLEEDRCYKSVNLSNIFTDKFIKNKKALQMMLSEGIAKGFVRPLTSVVFEPSNISRAFKLLSNRNNRGRVLIYMKDPANFKVTPRVTLSSNKTYIIVCDGTELGIELIDRLTQRGARRLLIHCNPKLLNGYFHVKYASWKKLGVTVEFSSDDLQTGLNCQNLFKKGRKLGPIDGIFMTQTILPNNMKIDQDYADITLAVSNLNVISRENSDLRYFAVVAVTSCNLTSSNKYGLEDIENCCILRNELGMPSLFLRCILNDKKLKPNFLTTLFDAMESSLEQQYASVITSDSIDRDVDTSVSNYAYTRVNTNFDGGLEAFYRHILDDEFIATEPIVQMKTKLTTGYKHELLLDPEDTHLMMIPGIEGNYKILSFVSEQLKKPAVALQLCPDINDCIPGMAKKLLNYVKMRFNLKSPFYIMGYSFGVNVALELAALLEKEGLVGVVFCLDSSPDAMRVHLDAYLGPLTDEQLQNSIIEHIFKLLVGHESKELKEDLEEVTNWPDKIKIFIKNVKNHAPQSHQYLRNLLQAAYDRIKMAQIYKPKLKLESDVVLLKGILHPKAEHINNDYNLSQYTTKPVQVYNIDSDHALAPSDCKVSNFMNRTFMI